MSKVQKMTGPETVFPFIDDVELKQKLLAEPILAKFTPGCPIQLHTDASGVGLGAMLMQRMDGAWRFVYAISRRLSTTERKYHSTKLEQLAVVWACERFRHYLYG